MNTEIRPIDRIKPYPGNPRQNDAAVDAVVASLREFGWRQPIVVDTEDVIVVGHTRYKAAQKLGLKQVPVHVATDLSPAQIKAYRIADNQTATIAEWDMKLLPIELAGLQEMQFDLGLLGFDEDELSQIMSGDVQQGLTDPDDVPAPPDDAVTPLFGNLIGVHDDQVDGVDVVAPVFNFNITKYFDSINAAYVDTLYRLTGTVNNGTWNAPVAPGVTLPFEKGEALFLGAAGSKRGDDPWEIAFAFAGSPNVSDVSVGDITIAAKEGWAYLWCRYQTAEDTTNKLLVMKPVMAIVERVYEYGAFGGLSL